MRLYLVRHGEAEQKEVNPEQPLTQRGRNDVGKVAVFLGRFGIESEQIRHSGKKRAEETALILAEHLSPAAGVRAIQGLAPQDNIVPVAEVMQLETKPVMLVSHLPFVERLAGYLLTGDQERTVVLLPPGGCVCLLKEEEQWFVAWSVNPDLL